MPCEGFLVRGARRGVERARLVGACGHEGQRREAQDGLFPAERAAERIGHSEATLGDRA